MQDGHSEIREDIFHRLVKLKGVGPATAHACTESVVQYLHALVEGVEVGTDDDGVTWMKRPEFIEEEWEYLTWSTERKIMWPMNDKPRPPEIGHDHWHSEEGVDEYPVYKHERPELWDSLPDVPPEQRLLRLY